MCSQTCQQGQIIQTPLHMSLTDPRFSRFFSSLLYPTKTKARQRPGVSSKTTQPAPPSGRRLRRWDRTTRVPLPRVFWGFGSPGVGRWVKPMWYMDPKDENGGVEGTDGWGGPPEDGGGWQGGSSRRDRGKRTIFFGGGEISGEVLFVIQSKNVPHAQWKVVSQLHGLCLWVGGGLNSCALLRCLEWNRFFFRLK